MLNTAKNELRIKIKNLISLMSSEEKRIQSNIIYEKLLKNQNFINSKRIAIYLSLEREVNTKQILNYCLNNGKKCFIPKYDPKSRDMDCVELYSMQDFEDLPLTKWQIKQPLIDDKNRAEALTSGGLDLILIPGIAFTKSGHRLGNGKGYYDSYLEKCLTHSTSKPFLIGLAFSQQIVEKVPIDRHDIQLDLVLYPDQNN
jgi:5-formyltetrahydrofolate cyclo-ligase